MSQREQEWKILYNVKDYLEGFGLYDMVWEAIGGFWAEERHD